MKHNVAVLMAAYNGKRYIQEQVESILFQIDVNITLFISIDMSTDGTREFLENLYDAYPEVIILKDIGHFGGAAKNFFRLIYDVDFSLYDYIAFSDQDDIWFSHKLVRAIKNLERENADGYSSNVLAFWEDGHEQLIIKSQYQCKYDYLFEAAGPGCTYVMTKRLALKIQEVIKNEWTSVQNIWLHDWFCYAYARANGFKWMIDEDPSMRYRQHASNQIGVNTGAEAFLHRLKKILYGGAIGQSLSIAKLIGMKNHCFVKKWADLNRLGFLKLALNASVCRRKKQEKVFFFIACILMAIIGKRK